jgi:hypothetical protein
MTSMCRSRRARLRRRCRCVSHPLHGAAVGLSYAWSQPAFFGSIATYAGAEAVQLRHRTVAAVNQLRIFAQELPAAAVPFFHAPPPASLRECTMGPEAAPRESRQCPSEKDAVSAQKLGQLQPFIAEFPRECVGQLTSFGPI